MEDETVGVEYCLDGTCAWSGYNVLLYRRTQECDWQTKARLAIEMQSGSCDCAAIRFGRRWGSAAIMELVGFFYGLPAA